MTNATNTKATETKDVFTRIAERDAAPAKIAQKIAKRYYVCVGSYEHAHTRRVYTRNQARRAVRLAKRFGMVDAYMSSPVECRV